jgi:site-specific DNA recombinase
MKAALYARYSIEKQSEASVADQLRVCERIAQRHGFEIVARFDDAAISGGTAQRPNYQAMLGAARRREFDVIVSEDSSRLWRSMAEQAPRLAELADLGLHVVTHDLDTRQESAAVLSAVIGSMAEHYRKEIGRRTRRGLEGRARQGKSAGGRAYGYVPPAQSATGEVEIDAKQADVVRWIFEQYAAGWSPLRIAADLNARGVPSPGATWNRSKRRKAKWVTSAIAGDKRKAAGVLNNDTYRGVVVWNRARWVRSAADSSRRRCVLNPRSEWIERKDERLRIVSDVLWQRVKDRQQRASARIGERVSRGISRQNAKRTGRGPKHLFSTLLQCGQCGANFVMVDKAFYACSSFKHGGRAACPNDFRVQRAVLEDGLLTGIRRELLAPEVLAEFKRRVVKRLADAQRAPAVDHKRIAELEDQVANLAEAIATGALKSSPALAGRLSAAEGELERLRAAAVPREESKVARVIPRIAEGFEELVADLPNAVKRDVDRARATIRRYVGDKILVAEEIQDGQPVVTFRTCKGLMEAAFLRVAGGSHVLQTSVVAGAGFEPATFGL